MLILMFCSVFVLVFVLVLVFVFVFVFVCVLFPVAQLFEHFAWEHGFLRTFAKHRVTGKALPPEVLDSLKASRSQHVHLDTLHQVLLLFLVVFLVGLLMLLMILFLLLLLFLFLNLLLAGCALCRSPEVK